MDQEWRKQFDAGSDALKEGNFKAAEELLYTALASAERFGEKDPRLANTLEQLVEANWYGGQFGQVEAHARRLLLLYQNTVGPDHFKTACISYRLATLYHYEQKLGLAEPLYKQVTTVMMKWLGSNHPELARIMDDYADLLHATHRTDQAEYIKRCAESIKAGRWGQPGQATAQNDKAETPAVNAGPISPPAPSSASASQSQPALVVSDNSKSMPKAPNLTPANIPPSVALSAQQKQPIVFNQPAQQPAPAKVSGMPAVASAPHPSSVLGGKPGGVIVPPAPAPQLGAAGTTPVVSPERTAASAGSQVNTNQFVPAVKVPPPANLQNVNARITQTMKNLDEVWNKTRAEAEAQTARGDFESAERSWYGAVKVAEKVTGNAQRLAYSLDSLGEVLCRQEKFYLAEPHFRRSFKLKKEALGEANPLVASAANTLAKLHYMQGHYREAEEFAEESAKIYESAHGKDHPDVATSLHNLATLYHIQCKYREAEHCYQRGLAVRKKTLGEDHPDTIRIKKNYADLLTTNNRHEEAQRLNDKATGLITGSWSVIEIAPQDSLTKSKD
jgi:tetratricopeptide (TPR) repeat protein